MCRVYGLWSERVEGPLYMVCERQRCNFLNKFGELGNGFLAVSEGGLELDKGGI